MSASKPSRLKSSGDAALVQDPHHDGFAVHRRHRRHAQVDLLALYPQADAAVLRQPPLGDVEVRHDLDARDHRGGEAARGRFDFVQHAVDPVADDEPVLERLDVDIGRARVERIGDDERDEPDHGRFGREILELLDVGVEREVVAALLDIADDLSHRRPPCAIQALERGVELGRDRDERLDLAAGDHPERADGVGVRRIGHRECELPLVLPDRQRTRLTQEARRNALFEDGEFGIAGRIDERQSQLDRERFRHVALRADAERDEQRAQLFAAFLLHAQRPVESRGIQLATLDQDFANAFATRCIHAELRPGSLEKSGR